MYIAPAMPLIPHINTIHGIYIYIYIHCISPIALPHLPHPVTATATARLTPPWRAHVYPMQLQLHMKLAELCPLSGECFAHRRGVVERGMVLEHGPAGDTIYVWLARRVHIGMLHMYACIVGSGDTVHK